VSKDVAPI